MSIEHAVADALRAALLLGLALAAMPVLRRAPAATRRLVLAFALAGALVLPIVAAVVPAWNVLPRPAGSAVVAEPPVEPLVDGAPTLGSPHGETVEPSRTAAAARHRVAPTVLLLAVWAIGALSVLARLAAGLLAARAMVRRASPARAWDAAVARAERVAGLRAEVRLTDALDTPAVTGIFAPVVLVPRASETWSEARRVAVLLHELAHVRQRDCLAQVVAQLACAVHWFDPLVWIAARRLRVERELAADDAVLVAGTRATTYAADLVAIAGGRPAPGGALGMAEPSQLSVRVAAIVASTVARGPVTPARAALVAAATAAAVLAAACVSVDSHDPTPLPSAPHAAPGAVSTLDPRLQQIADEELDRTVAAWHPDAATIVVLDPATGEVLANAGRARGARADLATGRAYVTGSTLKAVTLAAALEERAVAPSDRFDCENGARAYGHVVLHDSGAYGSLTVPEMMAVSSNVGFSKVFDRLGGQRLERWLHRFHFGVAPIAGAASGEVPGSIEDGSFDGAVVAIGETMTASPLQVAAAYAVFANGGAYVAPTFVRREGPAPREQVLSPETARTILSILEHVVDDERATGKAARVAGVRVAGKTGTGDFPLPGGGQGIYASFVGVVPADRPRFVILVGVEGPRGAEAGGVVAAPAFARVAARALGG